MLTTRCLRQAQYFSSHQCPEDEFRHFGLAMPIYTHFTSPIRRFADVIVHRQLAAAIGWTEVSENHTKSEKMEQIAANINYRHENAQRAGRDSQNLFTGFFLRKVGLGKQLVESGYVVKVTDTHLFVLVPRFGQEGKVSREGMAEDKVPRLLDKVTVGMTVRQQGDIFRTTLEYELLPVTAVSEGQTISDEEAARVAEEVAVPAPAESRKRERDGSE
jgi:exosome complex exonuclease DIS3/RRP44